MDGTDSQLGTNLVAAFHFLSRQGQIPSAVNILKLQGKSTKFLTDPNLEFRSIRLALSLASLVRPPARHLPVAGFRYAVRRAALHPRKNPSATAVRRSPVPCARRPRSRLGIPDRLRRSRGEHRFRQASSPPVQARQSAATFPVFVSASVHPCPEKRR